METAAQIQKFTRDCMLMHAVLRDGRDLTDMEYRLVETHLRMLADTLVLKQSGQGSGRKGRMAA